MEIQNKSVCLLVSPCSVEAMITIDIIASTASYEEEMMIVSLYSAVQNREFNQQYPKSSTLFSFLRFLLVFGVR